MVTLNNLCKKQVTESTITACPSAREWGSISVKLKSPARYNDNNLRAYGFIDIQDLSVCWTEADRRGVERKKSLTADVEIEITATLISGVIHIEPDPEEFYIDNTRNFSGFVVKDDDDDVWGDLTGYIVDAFFGAFTTTMKNDIEKATARAFIVQGVPRSTMKVS